MSNVDAPRFDPGAVVYYPWRAGAPSGINWYATMIARGQFSTWWVCRCCMLSHANGECCDSDHGGRHGYEPLSDIPADADVSMDDHQADCPDPDDYQCLRECVYRWMVQDSCPGCGDPHHGERHALFVVFGVR